MLVSVALISAFLRTDKTVYAEESWYLLDLGEPSDDMNLDDYNWDKSEELLKFEGPEFKRKKDRSAALIHGEPYHREVRQISFVRWIEDKKLSQIVPLASFHLVFKNTGDFDQYMLANEPDVEDKFLNVRISRALSSVR